jgi:beta-galactosidase
MMPLVTTGYGTPFTDPYVFVVGGRADRSNVKLGNGNERGVVSAPDKESHIGYSNIDFGSYGSDELILPLFPLSHDPFDFEIWEGLPGDEGAGHLATIHYALPPIWNTYQDVPCKLPRRLRGVTTLCFIFRGKVHVKGFIFTHYKKAFMRLSAAENDGINGDTFTIKDRAVEGIGNNVSIIFNDMDFGEEGASTITLSTRSALKGNSVQLMVGERRQMLEIPGTADYKPTTHTLAERIYGEQTVSLIFLPGCDIDIEWMEFAL